MATEPRTEVHPKCRVCGHVGNRTFVADQDGVLRDVLSPSLTFDSLRLHSECSRCGSRRDLKATTERPSDGN